MVPYPLRLGSSCLFVLTLLWAACSSADGKAQILSSVDGAKATAEWKYVKRGQRVVLSYSLGAVKGAVKEVEWFRVEPTAKSLDNTQPSFHFETVPYAEDEIAECRGKPVCTVEMAHKHLDAPRGLADVGSMAFRVKVTLEDGRTFVSPGADARVSGGIGPDVHRIAVRRDDTYLGFVTELIGTPYIFGSAGEGKKNQSDLLIGSDCADLAVYGRRRMGLKVEYTSSYAIDKAAPELAKATTQNSDGTFLDAKGKPIRVGGGKGEVQPGDVFHFPSSRHVAVFYEDKPPLGVLDSGDLMIHTCWAPPAVEAIKDNTMCASLPVRVLRWKASK